VRKQKKKDFTSAQAGQVPSNYSIHLKEECTFSLLTQGLENPARFLTSMEGFSLIFQQSCTNYMDCCVRTVKGKCPAALMTSLQ